jgi:hypothetical protein
VASQIGEQSLPHLQAHFFTWGLQRAKLQASLMGTRMGAYQLTNFIMCDDGTCAACQSGSAETETEGDEDEE